MKRLSAKLTYANVISTLCLALLVGGGTAYAATEMLPNNSVGAKQLKKEAVTPAKLSKAAKAALTGPAGPQGVAGSAGLQGAKGEAGVKGEPGEPGPLLETLPSGKTERGIFIAQNEMATVGTGTAIATIDFPFPLSAAPTPHYRTAVQGSSPECPGTVDQPEAAAGQLCLYEGEAPFNKFDAFIDAHGEVGASRFGTGVLFQNTSGNVVQAYGSWAVTAP